MNMNSTKMSMGPGVCWVTLILDNVLRRYLKVSYCTDSKFVSFENQNSLFIKR